MGKQEISRSEPVKRWSLDQPFRALHHEMNQLFDDFFADTRPRLRGAGFWPEEVTPSIDVSETDKAFQVSVEIPGVDEKDVEITLSDGILTIKGERKSETEKKGENYIRVERAYGTFRRALSLPSGVDEKKISAMSDKGVLRITLPKTQKAARGTRKIRIKSD